MKVLLVDDSKAARFAMSKLLKDQGLEVDVAASGEEALDKIAADPDISLVFMDQSMPGMGGLAATQHITSNEKTKHIPVVLCTGNEGEKLEQMAEEAGAIGVLTKPPEEEKLRAILASIQPQAVTPEAEPIAAAGMSQETAEAIQELQKAIAALQEQITTLQAQTEEKIQTALKEQEARLPSLLQSAVQDIDAKVSAQINEHITKESGSQRIQLEALRQQVESSLENMQEQEHKLRHGIVQETKRQVTQLLNEKLSGLKDKLNDAQHQVDTAVAQVKQELDKKANKGMALGMGAGAIVVALAALGLALKAMGLF